MQQKQQVAAQKSILFRQLPQKKKQALISRAKTKKPDGIVVIFECRHTSRFAKLVPELRLLLPPSSMITQCFPFIRKKIQLAQKSKVQESLFFFTQWNEFIPFNYYLKDLYRKHKSNEDGVLYLTFQEQKFSG